MTAIRHHRVQEKRLIGGQLVTWILQAAELPVHQAVLSVLQLGDAQVPTDRQVDQGCGHVDRVDAFVSDGAHQPGTHALGRLKDRLAVPDRTEGSDSRHVAGEGQIRPGAAMQPPQQQRTHHEGGQRRTRRGQVDPEGAVKVPLLMDLLSRRYLLRGETDREGHLLPGAPGAGLEHRRERIVGACGVDLAFVESPGRPRRAVHQLGSCSHLESAGGLLRRHRQSLQSSPGEHARLPVGSRLTPGGARHLVANLHRGGGLHRDHRVVPLHLGVDVLGASHLHTGDVIGVGAFPVDGCLIRYPLGQLRGRGVELDGLGDLENAGLVELSLKYI